MRRHPRIILVTGRAAMPLTGERGGGKLSTGSVEYPVPL